MLKSSDNSRKPSTDMPFRLPHKAFKLREQMGDVDFCVAFWFGARAVLDLWRRDVTAFGQASNEVHELADLVIQDLNEK